MTIQLPIHSIQQQYFIMEYQNTFVSESFFERVITLYYTQIILTLLLSRTLKLSTRKVLKLNFAEIRRDIDSNVREDKK